MKIQICIETSPFRFGLKIEDSEEEAPASLPPPAESAVSPRLKLLKLKEAA